MATSSLESNRPRRARAGLAAVASALVPGLGQAARGRLVDAALFVFAMLWLRGFLAGHAEPGDRLVAFVFGAPGIPGGLKTPVLVVFTALLVGLHVLAAWDAGRRAWAAVAEAADAARTSDAGEEKGSGEV